MKIEKLIVVLKIFLDLYIKKRYNTYIMMNEENEMETQNTHIVRVIVAGKVVEQHSFPTYGSAMRALLVLEEKNPKAFVEYRDIRSLMVG